jgi:glycine dehydrogenase subunit 2
LWSADDSRLSRSRSEGATRTRIVVPDSAHGTNPASAARCGYSVTSVASNEHGCVDLEAMQKALGSDVAAVMITNPNTLGVFEKDIEKLCAMAHDAGALVYMDGANMNAILGAVRPGDTGVDVMHFNVHKTFSTPHGGGGPGAGPVAVRDILEPFLPAPLVVKKRRRVLDAVGQAAKHRAASRFLGQCGHRAARSDLHLASW